MAGNPGVGRANYHPAQDPAGIPRGAVPAPAARLHVTGDGHRAELAKQINGCSSP